MDESKRVVQVQAFLHEHIQDVVDLETAVNGATNTKLHSGTYAWAADTPRHLLRRTNAYARYRKRSRGSKRKAEQKEKAKSFEDLSVTNSWSVKRMKLSSTFWGSATFRRKLALQPCSKGQRFMLKRSVERCTVHDMSYEAIVELTAAAHQPIAGVLRGMLSPTEHVIATTDINVASCRVVHVKMTYAYKSYPHGSIGPARMIWCDGGKRLVLLVHELVKERLLECIETAQAALSGEECRLSATDLSSKFHVFRLSGKESAATLRKCLGNVVKEGDAGTQMELLRACNVLPPNVAFGLDLKADELDHPEWLHRDEDAPISLTKLQQLLEQWTPNAFDRVGANQEESDASSLQAVVIKRKESSGVDIILPTRRHRLSARMFHKLVFCGASPSGIENEHLFATNRGQQFFPIDYPDTVAGREFWAQKARVELARLKRMPLSKIGKSHKELNRDGVVPRWEKLFTSSKESAVLVKYDGFTLDGKGETVQLLPVVFDLCHHQPKGVNARIQPNAEVYSCDPNHYKAWKQNPRSWSGVSCNELQLAGYITSSAGSGRIIGSGVVHGVGCIRAVNLSKDQQGRLMKGQDTFVLLRNPSCSRDTPCLVAFMRVIDTRS